jgi:group I intron endonuclease
MSEIYNDTYCVYAHINKTNGKIYIGQTCQKPEKRWNGGKGYKQSYYFYQAIQKYGWDGFDHEVLASNLTKTEADNFERLLIKKFDLLNPNNGYNLQDGGSYGRPSDISRINIKKAAQKRNLNEEWRLKQSQSHIGLQVGEKNGMFGKKHTEEAKQKQKEASLGKHHSDETRRKMSESKTGENNRMYGKNHSDETKKKISDALKNENHPNARKVNQYSLDGVLIKTWDYMKQATKTLGIPYQNISRCCRTGKGTAGGFKWSYEDEVNP